LVPERLREVDEDYALALAASIRTHGLLNPITVRATPRAARPYTLIAGVHRYRGAELAGLKEIEAAVVKADKAEARLMEVAENLIHNDLSVIDRAMCIIALREAWEA